MDHSMFKDDPNSVLIMKLPENTTVVAPATAAPAAINAIYVELERSGIG